jgi:biopolymer transport protein ExbD
MKSLINLVFVAVLVFLTSCATTVKFPVSSVTPAAEITAKKTQDKNKNYVIEVTAKNLASANRVDPTKKNYNVWIVTENNGTKNAGMLVNKNAKTASLKTSTPFDVKEIFITAEDQGDYSYPVGIEISRTTFK